MKNIILVFAILLLAVSTTAQTTPPVPAPDVELSANGGSSNLYHGWPLLLHVTILNTVGDTTDATGQLVIAPKNAAWTSAVSFTVRSSTGAVVQWPVHLIGTPSDQALTLGPTDYVQATWQMSAAEVSVLTPGDYSVAVNVQVSQSSGGWTGTAQSVPITLTVSAEPTLTLEQQAEKVYRSTEFALNNGDMGTAITLTQQLRIAQPDNALAGAMAASILNEAGYPELAFLQGSDALTTFYRVNPGATEAPFNFLPAYQDLVTSIATPDTSGPAPTTTSEASAALIYSPSAQTVQLSATVIATAGTVEAGSVTFSISGVNGAGITSPVTGGSAAASFLIPAGTHAGDYAMQASYGGTSAFAASGDNSAKLSIAKATPIVHWNNPADITAGTALGAGQLNATANVPGTFTYVPSSGTVLPVGASQRLSVTFVPTDSTDYNSAGAAVTITVNDVKPVPGDLNGDRLVNCADMAIVKNSFGKKTGQAGFDPRADVNHDGIVNVIDLSTVSRLLPAGTVCQ